MRPADNGCEVHEPAADLFEAVLGRAERGPGRGHHPYASARALLLPAEVAADLGVLEWKKTEPTWLSLRR
jgi:hypothetical protein